MDLIYTDDKREDIGVLTDYSLDLAIGADENNFECEIPSALHCCRKDYMLYVDGTEYGGIVDGIGVDTENNTVTYFGRTWHGILASKVILPRQPDDTSSNVTIAGTVNAYLIISGDAHDCIAYILERCGISTLFSVPETASGINITSYQFDRYTDAYKGLCKMLDSVGKLLTFKFSDGMIILSVTDKHDYSRTEEFDSDLVDFDMTKQENKVNHLICLGGGELENRLVIHLYADAEGNISETQTLFGLSEYATIYDYANVESADELLKEGKNKLKELHDTDKIDIDFEADDDLYNVGDIVGAIDNITGISVSAEIVKKIVTIKDGNANISYEVG